MCTHAHAVSIDVSDGRVTRRRHRPGRDRDRSRRQRRRHVRAGARRARRRQRPDRADGARVPRHAARGLPLDMPTMRDPSLLVYFRAGVGRPRHGRLRARPGAVVARRDPGGLQRQAPRGGLAALRGAAGERAPSACPLWEDMEVVRLINGPEAFTPDGEFILGPTDVRGFWVAAGFCAHGLAGAGGMGQLVAEWIVEGTPSLDVWHMDSRRFGDAYRSAAPTRSPARPRSTPRTTTSSIRGTSAPGGPTAPPLADLRPPAGAGRRLRREVGLGARELVRAERSRRGRRPAPARLGGQALVAGDRGRAPRLPRDRALFDESSFAKIEVLGRGRRGAARAALRQPRRPRRRRDHLHADAEPARRDRVRLHRDAARRGSLPDRHRHRLRAARPGLDPPARARGRLGPRRRRHLQVRCLGSGGRARACSWRRW